MGLFDMFLSQEKSDLIDACKFTNELVITIFKEFDKGEYWWRNTGSLQKVEFNLSKLRGALNDIHNAGLRVNINDRSTMRVPWVNGKEELFPMYQMCVNEVCKRIDAEMNKAYND